MTELYLQGGLWFASTILAALIGFILHTSLDRRHLPFVEKGRRKAVTGEWEGELSQQDNENRTGVTIPIQLSFKANARSVTGTMTIREREPEGIYTFDVTGSFHFDKYLRFEYGTSGSKDTTIDFGNMFMMLNNTSTEMTGKMVGFGSISNTLIASDIKLEKLT